VRHLFFAVLFTAAVSHAQAAVTSEAAMGPIRIQLFDLDTNDGITPYVTFSEPGFSMAIDGEVNGFLAVGFGGKGDYNDFVYESTQSSPGVPIYGRLGVTANGTLDGASMSVKASGSPTPSQNWLNINSYVHGPYSGYFTLSPHTALVVSSDATVWTSGVTATGSVTEARAIAGMDFEVYNDGGPQRWSDSIELDPTYRISKSFDETKNRAISVAFSNAAADEASGYFRANVSAFVAVTPVPEPSAWALLLCGTAAVFLLRRSSPA